MALGRATKGASAITGTDAKVQETQVQAVQSKNSRNIGGQRKALMLRSWLETRLGLLHCLGVLVVSNAVQAVPSLHVQRVDGCL